MRLVLVLAMLALAACAGAQRGALRLPPVPVEGSTRDVLALAGTWRGEFVSESGGRRGFIALAALIFGKWRPVQTLLACLLFGFTEAVSIQMQGVYKLPSGEDIPVQFISMVPYVLTIVVLAGFIGASRPPRALGIPYQKEK